VKEDAILYIFKSASAGQVIHGYPDDNCGNDYAEKHYPHAVSKCFISATQVSFHRPANIKDEQNADSGGGSLTNVIAKNGVIVDGCIKFFAGWCKGQNETDSYQPHDNVSS
jgi:hypothetical protein